MSARGPLVLLSAIAMLASGCATRVASTKVGEEKVVTKNYKWVYVTGSHIPVAVPISPDVKPPPGISPLTVLSPEQIRHLGGPFH
jgi:hypothetical protein